MGATGKGPKGTIESWVPTKDDPLCVCGEPKHTHLGGVGTSTENPACKGFVEDPKSVPQN